MLGGGYFTAQNKVIPGTYINFVGANRSTTLSDNGTVAMALELGWGPDLTIQAIDPDAAFKNAKNLFGVEYTDDSLKPIREVFAHAKKLLLCRLNGSGVKGTCTYGTAKYAGTVGNNLKVVIATDVDDSDKYDVSLYLGSSLVDLQIVETAAELVDNDYIVWDKEASLAVTAGTSLTGGTNSTVTGTQHTSFLSALENEAYNVLCTTSTDATVQSLYVAFTKRMIEEVGVKIQTVLYNKAADHEGIINEATSADLVPWLAGASASCPLGKTLTNFKYDGEYEITAQYTQADLKSAIENGKIVFHKVGNDYRLLRDINSLVTLTGDKTADFKQNQTVRVINQIGNDVATIFNTQFLGLTPNDKAGRIALWSALVDYFNKLVQLRAIEEFNPSDITVEMGETKNAVVVNTAIVPINCMEILYMTVLIG